VTSYTADIVFEFKNTSFFSNINPPTRQFICIDNVDRNANHDLVSLRIIEEYPNSLFRHIQTTLYEPFTWTKEPIKSVMTKEQFDSLWRVVSSAGKNVQDTGKS
jgi:hypothetical protein